MEQQRVKYPIGQQSFEQLRAAGYLYVDKTRYVEKIVQQSQYYFLGRPRRFGKSLFLTTLKAFFEGKRHLFKGLYIDSADWEWRPCPVMHLDLNLLRYDNDADLDNFLDEFLRNQEKLYGIMDPASTYSLRFAEVIRTAAQLTGQSVVILVDEYDKPLINNIGNPKRYERMRSLLGALYSNFKSSADYIRLVFLTGVSRFGKLSVFSDLNNIRDLSLEDDFAGICGITDEELCSDFHQGLAELAAASGDTVDAERARLKSYYDGYHFSDNCLDIYNPFSLLNTFAKRKYRNYWIESGTPTLLLKVLQQTGIDLDYLVNAICDSSDLSGLDIDNIRPIALFYQTGYLTIKEYNERRNIYRVGLPNKEVTEGFYSFILPYYANLRQKTVSSVINDFIDDLNHGASESFMRRLQSLFAGISYEMKMEEERNVQNAMLILFTLLGLDTDVEYRTSDGRIDILIRTADFIYIMELKFDSSAESAIAQIKEKRYDLPWSTGRRGIITIGINYSSAQRRIDSWVIDTAR
ncbi:MAG: ATP-binding protein [Muribaculaceae bacterium]|nr:ATP-binding protein [Muribaculaceae bacterium]